MPFHKSQLLRALKANVPIVNFITSDLQASIKKELKLLKADDSPFKGRIRSCSWNLTQGLTPSSNLPPNMQEEFYVRYGQPAETQNPVECLTKILPSNDDTDFANTGKSALFFFHNAHLFLASEGVQQAIANLREPLKKNHSILILLSPEEPSYQQGASIVKGLPASLKEDILIIEEEPLDDNEIGEIIEHAISPFSEKAVYTLMQQKTSKAKELLRGFSPFQTEQLASLMLNVKEGIDLNYLAAERNKMILATGGLSLYQGTETFADIQGCQNIKQFLGRILKHPERAPKAIVFIDEIEKSLAGITGDLSGVSQDYLGQLLSWMQDKQVAGMLFVGPPGTAKSAIAKITGNEGAIPSIIFDLGGLKGSLVGESERNLRKALKIINTLSQEKVLLIATSNNIDILPPELKRRFNLGTFFFDLPTREERMAIWVEYLNKFKLSCDIRTIDDFNWTGAEIRNCCDIADRLQCTLEEASKFIVPVYRFDSAKIDALRAKAKDKYISASYEGTFKYESLKNPTKTITPTKERDIML